MSLRLGGDGAITGCTSLAEPALTLSGLTVDTDTLVVDSTNNRVGIGTDSPATKLDVQGTGADAVLSLGRTDAATAGILLVGSGNNANFVTGGGTKDLFIATNNTEAMRINANGNVGIGTNSPAKTLDVNGEIRASTGMLFGTDTAAANTLDDYEEGTWTPGIEGTTTAGSYTLAGTGSYTKVGNKVTVWGELLNITTVSAGSGDLKVTGLPFTSDAAGPQLIGSVMLDKWDLSSTAYIYVVVQMINNVNYINPRIIRDSATDIALPITNKINDGSDIKFCITYTVA